MPTDEERAVEEERVAAGAARQLHGSGDDRRVAEHYQEMARRGVEQEGEGRIQ